MESQKIINLLEHEDKRHKFYQTKTGILLMTKTTIDILKMNQ